MSPEMSAFFWNDVAPELLVLLVAGFGWGLRRLEQSVGASVNAAHNQALSNAVGTFAGLVLQDIHDGKLTMDDVKDGHATADLLTYLNKTVSGAMLHFNKPPADLTEMLVGKLGQIAPATSSISINGPTNPISLTGPSVLAGKA